MEITINPYLSSDKPELIKLIRLNTPKYFDQSEEADFSNYLNLETEDYYTVRLGKTIVGCGGINYQNHNSAVISWDIIHPDYHGHGIGMQLLQFRINQIRDTKKFSRIIVRTSQFTDKFYERAGFLLKEITKNYWAEGIDLYYMVLDLD